MHHMTEYSPAKTPRTFPNFQNYMCWKNILRIVHTTASISCKSMLGYLLLDNICHEKRTVFLKLHSRKTVGFSEQRMSPGKYPSIYTFMNSDATVVTFNYLISFITVKIKTSRENKSLREYRSARARFGRMRNAVETQAKSKGFIKGRAPGKLTGCERDLANNVPSCFHLLI